MRHAIRMVMDNKDGIYDEAGRWLAPMRSNERLPAVPSKAGTF